MLRVFLSDASGEASRAVLAQLDNGGYLRVVTTLATIRNTFQRQVQSLHAMDRQAGHLPLYRGAGRQHHHRLAFACIGADLAEQLGSSAIARLPGMVVTCR